MTFSEICDVMIYGILKCTMANRSRRAKSNTHWTVMNINLQSEQDFIKFSMYLHTKMESLQFMGRVVTILTPS